MFNQTLFGENLKNHRKLKNLTQEEVAEKIGVSGQAVSKWEKGECLPDCYNLKLLGKIYQVSVDSLLDVDNSESEAEKVIETYKIENAVFELVQRPETVYAGKMVEQTEIFDNLAGRVLPERDIHISYNFWSDGKEKKIFFGREVTTENQPGGVDVYKMPAGLFLRVYTDKNNAGIIGKDMCEPWEFFSFMWNYIMPKYRLKKALNADGEDNQIEIYDSFNGSHGSGWGYAAVEREA